MNQLRKYLFSKIIINESDLIYKLQKGGGKGGQAVNKTNNCVILTHEKTGIQVKCHATRSTETNKQYAYKILKDKIDVQENGQESKQMKKINKLKKQKQKQMKRSKEKYNKQDQID